MDAKRYSAPDPMNSYHLCIAGIPLAIKTEQVFERDAAYLPFLSGEKSPRYTAVFRQREQLPPLPEEVLCRQVCCRVHSQGEDGYLRSFFDEPRDMEPYGVGRYDYDEGEIEISYLEKGKQCVDGFSNSFFHIGFEGLLIRENRICFHAACVDTDYGGILFSGSSGAGKSTQARLWQRHRGARLINGDRPILAMEEEGVGAWGSPYAGSSRCHVNERCSVGAVVMLEQASRCSVRRLEPGEAFRSIFKGLTIYQWDKEFVAAACGIVQQLVRQVPVYHLCCTADENAVQCLETVLEADGKKKANKRKPTEESQDKERRQIEITGG